MDSVNAMDIVGKTLYAKKRIALYKRAEDGVEPFMYVEPGQIVGVVASWVEPSKVSYIKRSHFYWEFEDPNGRLYYARHTSTSFRGRALASQGVLTTKQKLEAERLASLPWYERLGNRALTGAGFLLGTYLAIKALK
ncbi:MAG: hypothetical protein AAF741_15680 [Bacteroidota bacterium]